MISSLSSQKPRSPEETIRLLQRELVETNREVLELTLELEARVEERTAALQRAQQELEDKNARLEANNKELDAFSYSVSHDLRAPLRHLHGYANALVEDCHDALDAKGRQYVDRIVKAVDNMSALIDALLSFARTAQQHFERREIDSDQLVARIIAELRPEQGTRHIDWQLQPLPKVSGDAALLHQVWFNLMANSVKYTRNTPAAKIEVGLFEQTPTEFIFFVKDNGAGFDMNASEKLFGLFQRLHRQEEFEGTGLGLANVRRIVSRHGGRCWAEGAPGKGATFYFSLPRLGAKR